MTTPAPGAEKWGPSMEIRANAQPTTTTKAVPAAPVQPEAAPAPKRLRGFTSRLTLSKAAQTPPPEAKPAAPAAEAPAESIGSSVLGAIKSTVGKRVIGGVAAFAGINAFVGSGSAVAAGLVAAAGGVLGLGAVALGGAGYALYKKLS